ncbi:TPA: hypothetical protein ACGG3U_001613 [Legionella pneumophila]|nr:hypothetical protein [Legionella pneumophila]WBV63790.1 hypothetical protein PGH43_03130 [Legionella pneumophila 130b]AGH52913.1 hypothetical protein LPE509_00822 [Legionella pneumophila subsp. pneumophila LPE509]AGN15191.1 hypothetical protein LP6_2297 [Legionella pneumophila subsp. pneumophila str. Thunder Bay]AOU05227.1 hypothetical protein A9E97_11130 [Legionella pneumophila]AOU08240.1 hypothetical protein A9E98_11430 [Legionella pneumophila]
MNTPDPALSISNPRLLSAIYFGLLSVVGTILINAFLTSIGIEEIIPVYQSVILGMVVASCTGAIFGEAIVRCKKPYKRKTFWLGFSMVIASLPVFDLGLVFLMSEDHAKLFEVTTLTSMVLFYLIVLAYSYVLFGILLAIASGLAAMYLRGQLVYDILHTQTRRQQKHKHALAKSKSEGHAHKVHR